MAKNKETFNMYNVPCMKVSTHSDSHNMLVDMEEIPIDKLDEILEDITSDHIVKWLVEMDRYDFAYIWDKLQVRAKEMKNLDEE